MSISSSEMKSITYGDVSGIAEKGKFTFFIKNSEHTLTCTLSQLNSSISKIRDYFQNNGRLPSLISSNKFSLTKSQLVDFNLLSGVLIDIDKNN